MPSSCQWNRRIAAILTLSLIVLISLVTPTLSFAPHHVCRTSTRSMPSMSTSALSMAQISEQEARKGIDKVVATLRKDKKANEELGRLDQVTTILGFGSPTQGSIAVRFNASFKKGGFGLSSVPLPFGLGQSDKSEGRGKMVGQVKASLDSKTGKVISCSVFRDLGYGRSFELKC